MFENNSSLKLLQTWERGTPINVDNKHTTDYRYDANGERICKYSDLGETIYASGYYTETDGKKISKHIYIGSTRVASQVMSRTCETSTTMKRENTLYYHTDHLGSSGYVTDKKGEFYEHTEYTSSGESWVNEKVTGNANLPFKYTSKEQDAETGLYYYGARYYDARMSRWINTDPILEQYLPMTPNSDKSKEHNKKLPAGGVFNSVNLNAYHYAGNSPVVMIDPDGKLSVNSILRKLTSDEIEIARFFIGNGVKNSIDYRLFTVLETSYGGEAASHLGGLLVIHGIRSDNKHHKLKMIGILCHEIFHQMQYADNPGDYAKAVKEQAKYRSSNTYDPYKYEA